MFALFNFSTFLCFFFGDMQYTRKVSVAMKGISIPHQFFVPPSNPTPPPIDSPSHPMSVLRTSPQTSQNSTRHVHNNQTRRFGFFCTSVIIQVMITTTKGKRRVCGCCNATRYLSTRRDTSNFLNGDEAKRAKVVFLNPGAPVAKGTLFTKVFVFQVKFVIFLLFGKVV